jgi:hypothetical protein
VGELLWRLTTGEGVPALAREMLAMLAGQIEARRDDEEGDAAVNRLIASEH